MRRNASRERDRDDGTSAAGILSPAGPCLQVTGLLYASSMAAFVTVLDGQPL